MAGENQQFELQSIASRLGDGTALQTLAIKTWLEHPLISHMQALGFYPEAQLHIVALSRQVRRCSMSRNRVMGQQQCVSAEEPRIGSHKHLALDRCPTRRGGPWSRRETLQQRRRMRRQRRSPRKPRAVPPARCEGPGARCRVPGVFAKRD